MKNTTPTLYVLAGVTASGKSKLALQWATENQAEILSCDSVSIYKGMDIGSAKPDLLERNKIPHYGIDLHTLDEPCDVGKYSLYAQKRVHEIQEKGSQVLVVGGSGFYLQSFFYPVVDEIVVPVEVRCEVEDFYRINGLNSLVDRLKKLNPNGLGALDCLNPRRVLRALERCIVSGKSLTQLQTAFKMLPKPFPEMKKKVIWLDRENEELEIRIEQRTKKMLRAGLIEETKKLIGDGLLQNNPAASSIGYREVISYLEGKIQLDELQSMIESSTRKLVAKQRKWFRKHFPDDSRKKIAGDKGISSSDFNWFTGT